MIVTRLRINRFKKGDLRISLIKITIFITNKDPKLFTSQNPFDICERYNICIYIQYAYIFNSNIFIFIRKDKC